MRLSLRLSLILSIFLCAHVAFSQMDAFLWNPTGGMQDLGVMTGWQYSGGYGINKAGAIVGTLTKVQGQGYVNAAMGGGDRNALRSRAEPRQQLRYRCQ